MCIGRVRYEIGKFDSSSCRERVEVAHSDTIKARNPEAELVKVYTLNLEDPINYQSVQDLASK